MTAQPDDNGVDARSMPEKNLRAIRAALVVPQDRDAFDTSLKAVLDEVRVSLDLTMLNDFVNRWWFTACDSVRDPEGRRRMHALAEKVTTGHEVPPGRPWREILAERETEPTVV